MNICEIEQLKEDMRKALRSLDGDMPRIRNKEGIDDALIQPYSGHESRQSLEIYSRLSLADAQPSYNQAMERFPIQQTPRVRRAIASKSMRPVVLPLLIERARA